MTFNIQNLEKYFFLFQLGKVASLVFLSLSVVMSSIFSIEVDSNIELMLLFIFMALNVIEVEIVFRKVVKK
jgi:hypothetical protein